MAQQMQDVKTESRSPDAADELRIRKEEALKFIERDPDTQTYLQRSGLSYGTDDLGYLLDKYGAPTSTHVSQVIGNTSGAIEAERLAQERISRVRLHTNQSAPAVQAPMVDVAAPWRKEGEGDTGWVAQSSIPESSEAGPAPARRPDSSQGAVPPPIPSGRSTATAPYRQSQAAASPRAGGGDSASPRGTISGSTPLARVRSVGKLPASTQRRILPNMLSSLSGQLQSVSARRSQEKASRVSALAKVSRTVRPTLFLFVILLVGLAGFFDILDFFKTPIALIPFIGQFINIVVGVIKALTVGLAAVVMAQRVNRISAGVANIHSHATQLHTVASRRFPRVMRLASEAGLRGRLKGASPDVEKTSLGQFVRFQSRIVLNFILGSLLESIPIADLTPYSTLRLIRVYGQQQAEYRKAQMFILLSKLLIDKLDQQFDVELRYLTVCIRLTQRLMARASGVLQRSKEFVGTLVQPVRPTAYAANRARGPSPGSMYDIGAPSPAIGFAS